MTSYTFSIEIFGPGADPNNRSHWGFLITQPNNTDYGDLLKVIDDKKFGFPYAPRYGMKIVDRQAVWVCKIVDLAPQLRRRVIEVVGVAPPIDGVKSGISNCLLSLS